MKGIFLILTIYYSGDKIKNEMGRACGTCGRQDSRIQGLVAKPDRKRQLEDLSVDGTIKIDL
jgi:hypothetical protein